MILCELELDNFGVYRGRHAINLEPVSPDKPIILFGGLNGAGKTTILEAVQLALYGKRTPTVKKEGLSYDDYLRRCINADVPAHEGASVRLTFKLRAEGATQTIRISRTWHAARSGMKETEEVHVGDTSPQNFDAYLSAQWQEYIDGILPLGIAPLFFFDGDRIEGLADLASSGDIIRTAIHGLLGLDLVDRLALDLQVLERKKSAGGSSSTDREALARAERQLVEAVSHQEDVVKRVEMLEGRLNATLTRLEITERRFRKEGGELFVAREGLEAELKILRRDKSLIEEDLRRFASGAAPLALVHDLLVSIADEDTSDQAREADVVLSRVLAERDEWLVSELTRQDEVTMGTLDRIKALLSEDRQERRVESTGEPVFGLSREARHDLHALLAGGLKEVSEAIHGKLAESQAAQVMREDLERKLQGVPERDAIAGLLRERGELRSRVAEGERDLARAREEYERANRAVEGCERALTTLQRRVAEHEWEDLTAQRVVKFSRRSREILDEFRARVLNRNLERIQQLILQSFRELLRKDGLVHELEIDRETLGLRLFSSEGQILHPDRLSAGERQLLAVSILWGLARASHRILPNIVDTPLGRLDSTHRERLVARYFPHASHQVILLSTDEEIDEAQVKQLEPFIGRCYRLDYDDRTRSTVVVAGYFGSEAAA